MKKYISATLGYDYVWTLTEGEKSRQKEDVYHMV